MGLLDAATRWVAVTTDDRHCPGCGGVMERDYVRSPADQDHWRGVEADVCEDCGHAERV